MFVQCPFCQTKLSVSPESIPEMGKEKRCVNCMNRFRIVRTDDELVVQFQAPDGKASRAVDTSRSERSLHGNLTGVGGSPVQEKRYNILAEGDVSSSLDGGGSGVFADFLNINEAPPPADDGMSADDDEVPIEQSLKIDQVFGELSSDALSPSDTGRPLPRILSTKDLHERQERGFQRNFRVQAPASGRRGPDAGALLLVVRDFFTNLTPLDAVLVAAFVIVGFGAILGFTSAGFFGMNWLATDDRPQASKKVKEHARFTRDEVYNLINLAPDKKEARPTARFREDGTVLPDGDYSNLFVEDVEVAIRSIPPGAMVYRGEQALGATPLLVRMGRTEQMVVLRLEKEGFEPETLRFVGVESRAFDLPLRVLGSPSSSAYRASPKAPSTPKPTGPVEPKEKRPGDDFIIY